MFTTLNNKSETGFENRKWNHPNRKWNYFSYFRTFNQGTYFTKDWTLLSRITKMVFKTGNGIIQTGNGIFSPQHFSDPKKFSDPKISFDPKHFFDPTQF